MKFLSLLSFESIINRDYAVVFATLYIFSFIGLEDQNYILLILSSQVLLASISVAVFYKINKIFFSKKMSFYSSLLFSVIPLHVYACSQISSITLQIFSYMLFIYLLCSCSCVFSFSFVCLVCQCCFVCVLLVLFYIFICMFIFLC